MYRVYEEAEKIINERLVLEVGRTGRVWTKTEILEVIILESKE